jgi:hypothetical protein
MEDCDREWRRITAMYLSASFVSFDDNMGVAISPDENSAFLDYGKSIHPRGAFEHVHEVCEKARKTCEMTESLVSDNAKDALLKDEMSLPFVCMLILSDMSCVLWWRNEKKREKKSC